MSGDSEIWRWLDLRKSVEIQVEIWRFAFLQSKLRVKYVYTL